MKRAFYPADILLPKKGTDMHRWSVIACDQFTSEPEYWEEAERIVGAAPSTLRMILPEVYLDGPYEAERLERIRRSMEKYLSVDFFSEYRDAMIYVERTDSSGKIRAGVVGCIDLEQYDYHCGSRSLVRATEATVEERIPPRIRVRKNAPVELPHIMILIDDKNRTVVEPCEQDAASSRLLYDFDLMQGGGHLKGHLLGKEAQERILKALDRLAEQSAVAGRPAADEDFAGEEEPDGSAAMVFAVGDGNHSLASAKEFYEQLKAAHPDEDLSGHPARYAMAEIVNLHSPALEFEAIHRIITGVDVEELLEDATERLGLLFGDIADNALQEAGKKDDLTEAPQAIWLVRRGACQKAAITRPTSKLAVGSLQNYLDQWLKDHPAKIDYIHGVDTVIELSKEQDNLGFLLPDMGKEELFPSVAADGALPRKTFSMGHAEDKRYYTECRKIR